VLDSDDQLLKATDLPAPSVQAMSEVLEGFLAEAPSADAAGHRVVHGGQEFPGPIRIDEAADERLEQLSDSLRCTNRRRWLGSVPHADSVQD
jgi:acetate kinase